MATTGPDPVVRTRLDRMGGARFVVLVGVLLALVVGLAVQGPLDDLLAGPDPSGLTRAEIRRYRAAVIPTEENIRIYLDGKTVPAPVPDPAGLGTTIRLVAGRIGRMTLEQGTDGSLASFDVSADQGRYRVQIQVQHRPTDGSFAFYGFTVLSVSRR